jgi:hypothetical protein
LHYQFPTLGTSQDIPNVLALALLKLGWQDGDPHRLGHTAQNSRGELATFLASAVTVGNEDDVNSCKEPSELRCQTARVQAARQQAEAM